MSTVDRMAAGYEPNFDIDYAVGHEGELFVKRIVDSFATSSIEVKTDEMSAKTGKVYLEVQCLYRGEWKHSGIASSTADLWAHVMADEVVIVAPTHLVRRIAAYWWLSNKFIAECKRGSHPTKGVALPIKLFLNNLTDGVPDAPDSLPRPTADVAGTA
jgi:hypothetical protein